MGFFEPGDGFGRPRSLIYGLVRLNCPVPIAASNVQVEVYRVGRSERLTATSTNHTGAFVVSFEEDLTAKGKLNQDPLLIRSGGVERTVTRSAHDVYEVELLIPCPPGHDR